MNGLALSNVGFVGSLNSASTPAFTSTALLCYRASDITPSAWVNSGTSGSAHNLGIVGSAQVVTGASGTIPRSVRFDGTGHFESANNVPVSLLGSAPRTIALRVLVEATSANTNMMGYGVAANYQIVDLLFNTTLGVHLFGAGSSGPTLTVNTWMDFAIIFGDASTQNALSFYFNGTIAPASSAPQTLSTAASKLRVGVGTYTAIDNTARFSVAGAWMLDRICSATEIAQIFATL